jgi:hypothetical protein
MSQSVIGAGPIGFTAVGLDLLQTRVLDQLELPNDDDVSVEVPAYVVVAADVFSSFEERNQFKTDAFAGMSDRQLARHFQQGELPSGFKDQLREALDTLEGPLIVRPSSSLEASLERSFGGVYIAKLIPNVSDDSEKRLRQLIDAVKLVWASTYFADAVSSRLGAGQPVDSEQMALVIQQLVGIRHGDRFYPTISAVARSYNHYPAPGNEPGEGVVSLALGLGKIIAGGHAWSYCPDRPTAPPPFKGMNDLLKYTQNSFFAVDLSGSGAPDPNREEEFLVRLGLADAEQDGTLELLASTYDAQSDRLREGFDGEGPRALTFAPLLGSQAIPFSSVINRLVDRARQATGSEVEIELVCTLDPVSGVPVRFGVVQLKTMPGRTEKETLEIEDLAAEDVVAASDTCLGNGVRVDLIDLVYLKPEVFDRNQTRTMASELDAVNRGLLEEARSGIFIGFGRWGTTDERYGVPVRWGQISSAQVIVEITMAGAPLNPSHGTHFFHHVLSQHVLYLSVEHDGPHGVDFEWLAAQPVVWEGRYVRHVRVESPVEVDVDGATRRGVIRRPATE